MSRFGLDIRHLVEVERSCDNDYKVMHGNDINSLLLFISFIYLFLRSALLSPLAVHGTVYCVLNSRHICKENIRRTTFYLVRYYYTTPLGGGINILIAVVCPSVCPLLDPNS